MATEDQETSATAGDARGEQVLSPRALDGFLERIAEDLEEEPLDLPVAEHRARVVELFGALPERNHYQLLEVERQAEEEEIHAAYRRLARMVHPLHAPSLGFDGREATLRVLFERATEAYLTLSHPPRRAAYHTLAGLSGNGTAVSDEQRREEKREVAERYYRRATGCVANMEYSVAVDLLREAVRLDPRAESFALLGQALAKNRKWRDQALESYRRAAGMAPHDAGILLAFGDLLEEEGRLEEARGQYERVLDEMPDNVEAQEALLRVGGRRRKGGGFFGRRG